MPLWKTCETCHGKKVVPVRRYSPGTPEEEKEYKTCVDCGGEGAIEQPEEEWERKLRERIRGD